MTLGARWTFKEYWMRGWMQFAGRGPLGRFATRLATWFAPPFYKRNRMAFFSRKGYIAPSAEIDHSSLTLGMHSYIGERVKIIEEPGGGGIEIGDEVRLHWDITLHTGQGGTISIGPRSSVQPGCQFDSLRRLHSSRVRCAYRIELRVLPIQSRICARNIDCGPAANE